jgi:hypothetical protein
VEQILVIRVLVPAEKQDEARDVLMQFEDEVGFMSPMDMLRKLHGLDAEATVDGTEHHLLKRLSMS